MAADVPMAMDANTYASQSPAMVVASMALSEAASDRAVVYGPVNPNTRSLDPDAIQLQSTRAVPYGPVKPEVYGPIDPSAKSFAPAGFQFLAMESSSGSGSSSGSTCGCPASPQWEIGSMPTTPSSELIGTEVVDDFNAYYVERTTTVVYRWVEFGSGVIAAAGGQEITADFERWRSETVDVAVTAGVNSQNVSLQITSSASSSEGTRTSASVTIGGDPCYEEMATGIELVAVKVWVEVYHAKPGYSASWTNPIRGSGETQLGYKGALSVRVDRKCTG